MKRLPFFALFILSCLTSFVSQAQVVTLNPQFATQDDQVTVTFDATLGNGELVGETQVYAHTGVITNVSSSDTDWRHVQGTWGTPDASVQMTNLGNNKHSITYTISSFYNVPQNEEVQRLAFVFRNADGSAVGRSSDGSDIFVDIYPPNTFIGTITAPTAGTVIVDPIGTLDLEAASSAPADLKFFHEGVMIAEATNATSLSHTLDASLYGNGKFEITFTADDGTNTAQDNLFYITQGPPDVADPPAGIIDGINYIDDQTVILQLYAPGKGSAYVIGDFNNWEFDPLYFMKQTTSGDRYWIELTGLTPQQEYRFQYAVGNDLMRIADWYADKILDPWNDQYIDEVTYPNLIDYPSAFTTQPVSVFQTNQAPYNWTTAVDYDRPHPEKLVIYELLLRDFTEGHSYAELIDSLDYLERLGVNAIEFMPINEFEGNESWGYNPSFYFAPDKYYGSKDALKTLVDACHERGIAVILDIALNHSFGQSPMVRMYFDPSAGPYGQPTPDNPWFNETAKHDFNVGFDFNHESQDTKDFVDRVLNYWVDEFRIDGYRMDLSKGFTQNLTLGDIGAFGQYDASRVALLKRFADVHWNNHPESYIILEHFADNEEERELANYGFLLWGNINHEFNEATMGFSSNLEWADYKNRGWDDGHLVSYMESHDEERLMYRNQNFGNSGGDYDTKQLWTALRREEAAATMFFMLPGARMIWQFGEYGYDFSINRCVDGTIDESCRLANKPIVWEYLDNNDRKHLFQTYAALINLRNTFDPEVIDHESTLSGTTKRVHVSDVAGDGTNLLAVTNLNIIPKDVSPEFPHTGTWYEYFSGKTLFVENINQSIYLGPGDYRIYTDYPTETPEIITSSAELQATSIDEQAFPNPFSEETTFRFTLEQAGSVQLRITNLLGNTVYEERTAQAAGAQQISWNGNNQEAHKLPNGCYIYQINTAEGSLSGRVVLTR